MKLQIEGNRRTVQYAALQPVGTKPVQRAIDSHTATQIIHQYKYRVDGIIKAHVTGRGPLVPPTLRRAA